MKLLLSKTLHVMSAPMFSLGTAIVPGSGGIGVGLLLGVLTWPISVPLLLTVGPAAAAFDLHFKVHEERARRNLSSM